MARVTAWVARCRPDVVLLSIFVAILLVLQATFGGRLNPDKLTAKVPLVAVALLSIGATATRFRAGARSALAAPVAAPARVLADWLPAIFCIVVYENLHDVVKLVHAGTADQTLASVDARLFGVQPTLWLQRLVRPWLTDLLTFAYGSYFFTPTILAALLYANGRRQEFRVFMLVVLAAFYAGFVGYILVPAVGPLHFLRDQYTDPVHLYGIWLHGPAEAVMNDLRSINRDCFPSLHTAVSTLTLVYAWRMREAARWGRALAIVYTPLTVLLWFSTVYLRYHWVIDVLAGWALAWLVLAIVPRWFSWHRRHVDARSQGGLPDAPALARSSSAVVAGDGIGDRPAAAADR